MNTQELSDYVLKLLHESLDNDPRIIVVHRRTVQSIHIVTRDERFEVTINKIGDSHARQVPRGIR